MSSATKKTELAKWKNKLSKRLLSISEPLQRTILFADKIVTLEAMSAAALFYQATIDNFALRDHPSRILLEAGMTALLEEHWPAKHRVETLKATVKRGNRLVSIFLGHVRPGTQKDDDVFDLPDYGSDRPLTLGERRSLASQPDRRLIELAIADPHPMVIAKLLDNPKLTEKDVIYMSSKRPAPWAALAEIATHSKFRVKRPIARALINNPHLPVSVALTLLPCLDVPYLKVIKNDLKIKTLIREAAQQILLAIS